MLTQSGLNPPPQVHLPAAPCCPAHTRGFFGEGKDQATPGRDPGRGMKGSVTWTTSLTTLQPAVGRKWGWGGDHRRSVGGKAAA